MSNPSKTPPLFAQSAQDIIERLKDDEGPEPEAMRLKALELLRQFAGWMDEAPEAADRLRAISELFALYGRVLDYRSAAIKK